MNHDDIEARFARLEQRLAQVDAQLAVTRQAVARMEARLDAHLDRAAGETSVAIDALDDITARLAALEPRAVAERDASRPAGPLPWILSEDGSKWRAELPDGRTAVLERLLDADGLGSSFFLPTVHESAGDFEAGPLCHGVLEAANWVADFAGRMR